MPGLPFSTVSPAASINDGMIITAASIIIFSFSFPPYYYIYSKARYETAGFTLRAKRNSLILSMS